MMKVALWISRRLRLGGNGTGSPAAVVIAVAGVALAIVVMEFTLAIVVGFKDGIKAKLTGFDAQISIESPVGAGDHFISVTPELSDVVRSVLPEGAEMRLSLRQPGMLKTDDNFQGVIFLGQAPDGDFSFERSNIVEGEWPDFMADSYDNTIVLSRTLASSLGLALGDKVYSTFIVDGAVKMRRHTIGALYQSNFGEYDNSIVYCSLNGLRRVVGADSISGTRLDIRGIDMDNIDSESELIRHALVSAAAVGKLNDYYPVDNILRSGALYFNWLSLLDTNVVVIFILMLAVAGFTLVSSLFILILERVRTIGVLRAIGASKPFVRNIFVDLGMRLVGLGMVIGNIIGIGLLLIQRYTHAIPLDPDMYYLASVPVEIRVWAFIALNIGVLAASWLILIVPARVAASTDPAKAIECD